MTAPLPTAPWLLPVEFDELDPDLRGLIPDVDREWWATRAQDRITDSPQSAIPLTPTPADLQALKRAAIAWIEWQLNTGNVDGQRIQIGHVELEGTSGTSREEIPLPGVVLSILASAGLLAQPRRAVAW